MVLDAVVEEAKEETDVLLEFDALADGEEVLATDRPEVGVVQEQVREFARAMGLSTQLERQLDQLPAGHPGLLPGEPGPQAGEERSERLHRTGAAVQGGELEERIDVIGRSIGVRRQVPPSRLGVTGAPASRPMCVVVESRGEAVCLMVDAVGDVVSVEDRAVLPNPGSLPAAWAELSRGVYRLNDHLLLLLDVDQLLSW